MGLLPKEYNEFIVYWLPLLEKNEYNLITFAGKEYTNVARLKINPKPDAILRVFMVFKSLDKQIEIPPQQMKKSTLDSLAYNILWFAEMKRKLYRSAGGYP